jgi:3-deoxy-manno-octulosonate cytidylyltransferase (CMP-KDO synthetase)
MRSNALFEAVRKGVTPFHADLYRIPARRSEMKSAIVIPARYGSQRLPGKPLLRATGKYLIQHVYEQACRSQRAETVVVATDDPRIEAAVKRFGGRVVQTSRHHSCGTERVAEVAGRLDVDVVINLQGDEPLIEPATLDMLPALLERDERADVATLAVPITSVEQWHNPSCVKVVCDSRGRALYFSRSPIPFIRDGQPDWQREPPLLLHHLGIYAYRRAFLLQLAAAPPAVLEQVEKLEQLRVLSMGSVIQVGVTRQPAIGVDTMEEYEQFVRIYRNKPNIRAA